jgi:hypothetical protein
LGVFFGLPGGAIDSSKYTRAGIKLVAEQPI